MKKISRFGIFAALAIGLVVPMASDAFAAGPRNESTVKAQAQKRSVRKVKVSNKAKKTGCNVAFQARTRAGCFARVTALSDFF